MSQRVRGLSIAPVLIIIVAGALLSLPVLGVNDVTAQEGVNRFHAAVRTRAKYGLPIDDATVKFAISDGHDVGTTAYGVPMTQAEAEEIDFDGRADFVNRLDEDLIPFVRGLPNFAGLWIDQIHGGRVVVMLVGPTDAQEADIVRHLPTRNLGIAVDRAQYTYAELERAFRDLPEAWNSVGSVRQWGVAIDEISNGLTVDVLEEDAKAALTVASSASDVLGVPVVVTPGREGNDVDTCGNRSNCHDPMKAGLRIWREGLPSTQQGPWNRYMCSTAFQITAAGGSPLHQFLTAGHCGWPASNDPDYYHFGVSTSGYVGSRKSNQIDSSDHRDIMKIGIADTNQWSALVFGDFTPQTLLASAHPVANDHLCSSLGNQNIVVCGTVQEAMRSWWSETYQGFVYGAALDTDNGNTVIGGDSGSPIYRRVFTPIGIYEYTPIGVVDHEFYEAGSSHCCQGGYDIYFARVKDALNDWGATIYR